MGLKKYLIIGLICFLIGAIICGAIFYCARDKPDPIKADLMINPTPKQLKQAEAVKEVNHSFTIKQPDKMVPGESQTIPVAVKVKDAATHTTQDATATAEATKTPEGDIEVTLSEVIAIDTPKPPPKRNEVGVAYTGDWVIYYKRDIVSVGNVVPWVGAAYN